MKVVSLVCLLVLLLPAFGAEGGRESLAPTVSAFIAFTKDLFQKGNELLDILARSQSENVAKQIYSQARKIKEDKSQLRRKFAEGTIADGASSAEVRKLETPARDLAATLQRFGSQIESVSELKAGPLVSRTNELIRSKLAELSQAAGVYKSGDPASRAEAARRLDVAIADMDGVMDAASCLLDTIKQKAVVCDSNLKRLQGR
ncbi:MAG: hypothetical protein ABI759_16400 [Candidatus Solibacter sp.]